MLSFDWVFHIGSSASQRTTCKCNIDTRDEQSLSWSKTWNNVELKKWALFKHYFQHISITRHCENVYKLNVEGVLRDTWWPVTFFCLLRNFYSNKEHYGFENPFCIVQRCSFGHVSGNSHNSALVVNKDGFTVVSADGLYLGRGELKNLYYTVSM